MDIVVTPSYRNFFSEDKPSLEELLGGIPSYAVIGFLSMINTELYAGEGDIETQRKIFKYWTRRFEPTEKDRIINALLPFIHKGKDNATIFTFKYTLEFIKYELLNFRVLEDFEDTTPEQEYNLFKAYLIIVEEVNDRHVDILQDKSLKDEKFLFQSTTWSQLIDQFPYLLPTDPIYHSIKGLVFLEALNEHQKYEKYVQNFLKEVGKDTFWHYIFDFYALIKVGMKENPNTGFHYGAITGTPNFQNFLDFFSIDIKEFKSNDFKQKDYLGIREKPLFKYSDSRYFVMNWSFLISQMYLGLLFDFYARSGIKNEFPKFPDFRSFLSSEISEKILFRKILSKALYNKHATIVFDENEEDNAPDLYYRLGNYIFLIEFKDILVSANVIHSASYKTIKEDIDRKLILNNKGENKGILQILEQIKILSSGGFKFDSLANKGIKSRNLTIYPIIVYTDITYSMSGINDYLEKRFREELNTIQESSPLNIRRVKNLTMINFKFFFNNFHFLSSSKIKFRELIDTYHKEVERREKRFRRVLKTQEANMTEEFMKIYICFEETHGNLNKKSSNASNIHDENYVRELIQTLELTKNLPPE